MLVWATIAALLVLVLAALLGLVWSEDPVADDTAEGQPANRFHGVVTPDYLREVRIPGHGRGYDRATVDVLLERAAEALEQVSASGQEVEDGGGDEAGGFDR